jgi:hypothetical protein
MLTDPSIGFQTSIPDEWPPATTTSFSPLLPVTIAQVLMVRLLFSSTVCLVNSIVVQSNVVIASGLTIPPKKTETVSFI